MNRLSFPALVLVGFLCSCTRDNATQYETAPTAETVESSVAPAPQVTFQRFTQELPALTLPFTATCSFDYVLAETIDTATTRAFLKPLELPYRRIPVSKGVTAVLALFPADETLPRLRTFSQEGVLLDEQDLKFNPCGEEPGFSHSEQFTIQKDLSIVHLDSTTRWQFDAQYNEVPNTRKLTVTRKRFTITANGQITETK